MTPELQDHVLNRLVESGAADQPWALAVLAALEGEAPLKAFLDGTTSPNRPAGSKSSESRPAAEPPGVYVSAITVEGFRGIGRAATLVLHPGPGLTLVVGRNGSGKSSFAEALEFLLTGHNLRWEKRPKAWLEGWRNLHHHETVSLRADLLVEGQGKVRVSRAWNGDQLTGNQATAKRDGQSAQPLQALGWDDALVTFRPFLSYNELGALLEEGPSKLYDALSSVLGLEELVGVQNLLGAARRARQETVDQAAEEAEEVSTLAEDARARSADSRLAVAADALRLSPWDLATLDALVRDDSGSHAAADVDLLRHLAVLIPPDFPAVADVVERLRAADRACAAFAGTHVERARERARLLEEALRFHQRHRIEDCPVCGASGALSGAWRDATEEEVKRLRQEASASEGADAQRRAVLREAQTFVSAAPPALAEAAALGLGSLDVARRRWDRWSDARDLDSASALADHLEAQVLDLVESVKALADEAASELRRREDAWRPVSAAITFWLPRAHTALHEKQRIAELKAAEAWWKEASGAIRDERFAPIAQRALTVWKQLRLQSNVDLGGVELEGTAQRRRVTLKVTVDGTPAEALGVMSQGELHSMALSLFLPRATLPASPFRFVAIDDPVQSMDPARVEGLARTFAEAARTRQVIVFTHDDRLPEAVRRLGIPATVLGVTRKADSFVEVKQTTDPVTGYLEDARALESTSELPRDIAARVIPGFCRAAVEAACMDRVRRRRLARGQRHEEIEALLTQQSKTYPLMALALFDDEERAGDVLQRLDRVGRWAPSAFKACKSGGHEAYDGDLKDLITASERLARYVTELS